MSPPGTLDSGESLRLFLALLLPLHVEKRLERWSASSLEQGRRVESFHVTLAFLGSRPRSELDGIVGALRESVREADPFVFELERYRETRSVGMLVLTDPTGEACRLASRLHMRLEDLGVYRPEARPWLPHVTVLRFRDRPRLSPQVESLRTDVGAFAPSEAAAFVSRLHPSGARHEVLEHCALGG